MPFSATDAAFEGFRLVRRNPVVLVAWTALYGALNLAVLFAMGPVLEQLVDWQGQANALESSNPDDLSAVWALMADFGQIMAQMAWMIPALMVVEAMLLAAVARGVLKSRTGGTFGYLKLGMDEVRVLVVTFVLGLLMTLVAVGAVIAVTIVIMAARTAGIGAWSGLVAVLGMIAVVVLLIWLAVRLSLAVPITVAERRFAFFDSFSLTRGRFWPLLGMAIIAGVMVMVIQLLSTVVSLPIGMMSGIETWSMGPDSSPEDLRAALDIGNPWVIATVMVDAIVKALTVGVLYAPFSAAYRDIKGLGAETPAA